MDSYLATHFNMLFTSKSKILKKAASTLSCIKFVKSSPLCSTSLLSLCPQLAARLGRRPAPGNLCTITYADLAAAGHHVCSRMWALGRCYEGGIKGGMLQAKRERMKEEEEEEVGTEGQHKVHRSLKWAWLCSKVIFDCRAEVVNGFNCVQNCGTRVLCHLSYLKDQMTDGSMEGQPGQ